jgi:transposase InsO family protein
MAPETRHRDDEAAVLLALFRYGVIAPLVETAAEDRALGELTRLVREIAQTTHYLPGKGPVQVAERTIYAWLSAYRKGGIEALRPRLRSDQGSPRVVSEPLLTRAVALRKEAPHRFTKTLLDILQLEGAFRGASLPHRSTLDRHLARRGASRRQMRVLGEKRTIKMRFTSFGELWVGDYHHGPLVVDPDGNPTTSKLGAFLDHATRYPVADRYYLAEDLASLRDGLLRALLTWGRAHKVYVDRGAVYRSERLRYSLATLDIHLVHSRAYYSQGRGVIERWWQVVNQFEHEVRLRDELLSIHELNLFWQAYRERRYLSEIHSDLGMTPEQAVATVVPQPIAPEVLRELFLVRADRTVHRKDGCVAVEGRRFLCASYLRGQQVQVRYDLQDFSSVLLFTRDGKRLERAFPQPLNATPEPHPQPPETLPQSVDYLALLREDFDRSLLEHARPLAYAELTPDPGFGREHFIETLCALAALTLTAHQQRELRAFWDTFAPLPEPLVRIGLEHAVRLHGRGRHLRVYLHAVRTLVLAHRLAPPKEAP